MKKELRGIALLCTGLLALAPVVVAQPKAIKPRKNEVVLIGRFSMMPAINLDFFWEAYKESDMDTRKREKTAKSWLEYYLGSQRKTQKREDTLQISDLGNLSTALVAIPTDRTIFLKNVQIRLFGLEEFFITLPIYSKIVLPEGSNYVYIGSLEYVSEGEFLELKTVNLRDEFDDALAFVRRTYGEDAKLVRVNLIAEEEE